MKVCPPLVTYYGLRYFASQASVRSTTHRCRPSLLLFSLPFRAILLLMPCFLRTWQHFLASSASSARSVAGHLRGVPDLAPDRLYSVHQFLEYIAQRYYLLSTSPVPHRTGAMLSFEKTSSRKVSE